MPRLCLDQALRRAPARPRQRPHLVAPKGARPHTRLRAQPHAALHCRSLPRPAAAPAAHRYGSTDEGSAMVVVAPVLRFKEVGVNANVTIKELGAPENLIAGGWVGGWVGSSCAQRLRSGPLGRVCCGWGGLGWVAACGCKCRRGLCPSCARAPALLQALHPSCTARHCQRAIFSTVRCGACGASERSPCYAAGSPGHCVAPSGRRPAGAHASWAGRASWPVL